MKGSPTYFLNTGITAAERLEMQNKIIADHSYRYLAKAGLTKGQIIFDIGCGNGVMTEYLAKAVGEKGHIYAIDICDKQIAIAKERILQEGLNNVTFIEADITANNNLLPHNTADIIYMRFVLMHLLKPEEAAKNLISLLKPEGVIVSQESWLENSIHISLAPLFSLYENSFIALGKHNGLNYNLGKDLGNLFKNVGFNNVEFEYVFSDYTAKDAKKIFLLGFAEWGNKALEAKIITQQQAEEIENGFKAIIDSEEKYIRRSYCMALARKNNN